jgi:hypothetical protein
MTAKDVHFPKQPQLLPNWRRVWAPVMLGLGVIVTFLWMALLAYGIVGFFFWAV